MDEPSAEAREQAREIVRLWRIAVGSFAVPERDYHDDEDYERLSLDIARALAEKDAEARARFTAPVVCLCGSTRFRSTWAEQVGRLTDEGYIVLSVGRMLPKATREFDPAHKAQLDELHKRKIDLADSVFVLDVGGYLGESTRSEIEYATAKGKPITYLSVEFPDYVEPRDHIGTLEADLAAMRAENEELKRRLGDA